MEDGLRHYPLDLHFCKGKVVLELSPSLLLHLVFFSNKCFLKLTEGKQTKEVANGSLCSCLGRDPGVILGAYISGLSQNHLF